MSHNNNNNNSRYNHGSKEPPPNNQYNSSCDINNNSHSNIRPDSNQYPVNNRNQQYNQHNSPNGDRQLNNQHNYQNNTSSHNSRYPQHPTSDNDLHPHRHQQIQNQQQQNYQQQQPHHHQQHQPPQHQQPQYHPPVTYNHYPQHPSTLNNDCPPQEQQYPPPLINNSRYPQSSDTGHQHQHQPTNQPTHQPQLNINIQKRSVVNPSSSNVTQKQIFTSSYKKKEKNLFDDDDDDDDDDNDDDDNGNGCGDRYNDNDINRNYPPQSLQKPYPSNKPSKLTIEKSTQSSHPRQQQHQPKASTRPPVQQHQVSQLPVSQHKPTIQSMHSKLTTSSQVINKHEQRPHQSVSFQQQQQTDPIIESDILNSLQSAINTSKLPSKQSYQQQNNTHNNTNNNTNNNTKMSNKPNQTALHPISTTTAAAGAGGFGYTNTKIDKFNDKKDLDMIDLQQLQGKIYEKQIKDDPNHNVLTIPDENLIIMILEREYPHLIDSVLINSYKEQILLCYTNQILYYQQQQELLVKQQEKYKKNELINIQKAKQQIIQMKVNKQQQQQQAQISLPQQGAVQQQQQNSSLSSTTTQNTNNNNNNITDINNNNQNNNQNNISEESINNELLQIQKELLKTIATSKTTNVKGSKAMNLQLDYDELKTKQKSFVSAGILGGGGATHPVDSIKGRTGAGTDTGDGGDVESCNKNMSNGNDNGIKSSLNIKGNRVEKKLKNKVSSWDDAADDDDDDDDDDDNNNDNKNNNDDGTREKDQEIDITSHQLNDKTVITVQSPPHPPQEHQQQGNLSSQLNQMAPVNPTMIMMMQNSIQNNTPTQILPTSSIPPNMMMNMMMTNNAIPQEQLYQQQIYQHPYQHYPQQEMYQQQPYQQLYQQQYAPPYQQIQPQMYADPQFQQQQLYLQQFYQLQQQQLLYQQQQQAWIDPTAAANLSQQQSWADTTAMTNLFLSVAQQAQQLQQPLQQPQQEQEQEQEQGHQICNNNTMNDTNQQIDELSSIYLNTDTITATTSNNNNKNKNKNKNKKNKKKLLHDEFIKRQIDLPNSNDELQALYKKNITYRLYMDTLKIRHLKHTAPSIYQLQKEKEQLLYYKYQNKRLYNINQEKFKTINDQNNTANKDYNLYQTLQYLQHPDITRIRYVKYPSIIINQIDSNTPSDLQNFLLFKHSQSSYIMPILSKKQNVLYQTDMYLNDRHETSFILNQNSSNNNNNENNNEKNRDTNINNTNKYNFYHNITSNHGNKRKFNGDNNNNKNNKKNNRNKNSVQKHDNNKNTPDNDNNIKRQKTSYSSDFYVKYDTFQDDDAINKNKADNNNNNNNNDTIDNHDVYVDTGFYTISITNLPMWIDSHWLLMYCGVYGYDIAKIDLKTPNNNKYGENCNGDAAYTQQNSAVNTKEREVVEEVNIFQPIQQYSTLRYEYCIYLDMLQDKFNQYKINYENFDKNVVENFEKKKRKVFFDNFLSSIQVYPPLRDNIDIDSDNNNTNENDMIDDHYNTQQYNNNNHQNNNNNNQQNNNTQYNNNRGNYKKRDYNSSFIKEIDDFNHIFNQQYVDYQYNLRSEILSPSSSSTSEKNENNEKYSNVLTALITFTNCLKINIEQMVKDLDHFNLCGNILSVSLISQPPSSSSFCSSSTRGSDSHHNDHNNHGNHSNYNNGHRHYNNNNYPITCCASHIITAHQFGYTLDAYRLKLYQFTNVPSSAAINTTGNHAALSIHLPKCCDFIIKQKYKRLFECYGRLKINNVFIQHNNNNNNSNSNNNNNDNNNKNDEKKIFLQDKINDHLSRFDHISINQYINSFQVKDKAERIDDNNKNNNNNNNNKNNNNNNNKNNNNNNEKQNNTITANSFHRTNRHPYILLPNTPYIQIEYPKSVIDMRIIDTIAEDIAKTPQIEIKIKNKNSDHYDDNDTIQGSKFLLYEEVLSKRMYKEYLNLIGTTPEDHYKQSIDIELNKLMKDNTNNNHNNNNHRLFLLYFNENNIIYKQYGFLFDINHIHRLYYQWRLYSLLQGDELNTYSLSPFQIYSNGPLVIPPAPYKQPTNNQNKK